MVRVIIKDITTLSQVSSKFESGDEHLIQDMLDTAEHHSINCAGLACIQIGVPKRIIVVKMGNSFVPFINPVILQKSKSTYIATEGCLSLDDKHEVRRHHTIKVGYTTKDGKHKLQTFNGFTAQIIQHEVDHLNGKLV